MHVTAIIYVVNNREQEAFTRSEEDSNDPTFSIFLEKYKEEESRERNLKVHTSVLP